MMGGSRGPRGKTGPGGGGGGASGSSTPAVVNKSSAYTITLSDAIINADATAASFNLTLPSAATAFSGGKSQLFTVTKIDATANTVTVLAGGADTILGLASAILSSQGNSVSFYTDGGKWYVQ